MFTRPGNYWKTLEYVLLTLVCFVLQSVPAFGVRFMECAPSLLLLLTVGVAFFESPSFSAWFGLIAGLLAEMTTSSVVGLDAILFMFAGYFIAVSLELALQRKFLVYLTLCLGLLAVQQLLQYAFHLLIWETIPFGVALVKKILPTFFFSGIFAYPIYGILWHYENKFRRQEELL